MNDLLFQLQPPAVDIVLLHLSGEHTKKKQKTNDDHIKKATDPQTVSQIITEKALTKKQNKAAATERDNNVNKQQHLLILIKHVRE